ncbi:MAG TPA: helix-turn-helix transcriptional regulator [Clostridiales bacterium]|jgi:ArsR family transcriptional regulator|nr:helix-turn-helix transcriptional regulator [Clostridiales bacterium]
MTKIKENNGDDIGAAAASAARLPDEETLCEVAELFKLFADSTRIRILYALAAAGELSVTGIAEELEMSQSAISHQLRLLRRSRLIRVRREGKNMFYSLADDHVRTILGMGIEHILE